MIILAYFAAITVGFLTLWLTSSLHPLISMLLADVAATMVIFLFSIILDNSSAYDPYWSVIPPLIALGYWALNPVLDPVKAMLMLVVILWAIRLTANWARSWPGLIHEDWRYVEFRQRFGRMYWLVSLGGIHMFPTAIVFLGMLPTFYVFQAPYTSFNVITLIASAVGIIAVLIELVADEQMRYFRKKNPKNTVSSGLWRYSRHPNYFGEVLFWVSMYLFSIQIGITNWWNLAAPLSMLFMFLFVSIPWMDRRQLKRRGESFQAYYNSTSAFFPWFPGKTDQVVQPLQGESGND
jgi:steroid 5-alpha reductase family enzyme